MGLNTNEIVKLLSLITPGVKSKVGSWAKVLLKLQRDYVVKSGSSDCPFCGKNMWWEVRNKAIHCC